MQGIGRTGIRVVVRLCLAARRRLRTRGCTHIRTAWIAVPVTVTVTDQSSDRCTLRPGPVSSIIRAVSAGGVLFHLHYVPTTIRIRAIDLSTITRRRTTAKIYNAWMTRGSHGFRRMAWLAVLAMLLIAAVPTVSRVLAATIPAVGPALQQMCTAAGLKVVEVIPFGDERKAPAQPMTTVGDVCGYCLLSTPVPLILLLAFALLLHAPAPPAQRPCSLFLRLPRNLRGLGSQAPPLAL